MDNQAHWFLANETPVTFPPLHQKGWCRYYAIPDFVCSYFRLLALGSCGGDKGAGSIDDKRISMLKFSQN
ncbi:hypothetical protein VKI21_18390 [Cyanobacterium aponinum UTEX 3222]|uniref:hypothetical protein n=1 Tax=Cyanobacterium aponinum TaxID=379064 RepID=UPI00308D8AEA|nr:hypothetical protein VKI21_18390 [Cyanobacterium aponinum UTEX 3222]